MARRDELNDRQWVVIKSLLPKPSRRADGKGRPRREDREVLNGILWILRSGARWQDLPERFPPYQTCHRRFQQWAQAGVLRQVLEALAEDLRTRGKLDLGECFVDATFVAAKKGALASVHRGAAKAPSSWQWQTALVFQSRRTRRLLARMKSPLSKTLSPNASLMPRPASSSATGLMTAIGLIESLLRKA